MEKQLYDPAASANGDGLLFDNNNNNNNEMMQQMLQMQQMQMQQMQHQQQMQQPLFDGASADQQLPFDQQEEYYGQNQNGAGADDYYGEEQALSDYSEEQTAQLQHLLDANPLGNTSAGMGMARPTTSRSSGHGDGARPSTADEGELRKALAALPKVFVAAGGAEKTHKVCDSSLAFCSPLTVRPCE